MRRVISIIIIIAIIKNHLTTFSTLRMKRGAVLYFEMTKMRFVIIIVIIIIKLIGAPSTSTQITRVWVVRMVKSIQVQHVVIHALTIMAAWVAPRIG